MLTKARSQFELASEMLSEDVPKVSTKEAADIILKLVHKLLQEGSISYKDYFNQMNVKVGRKLLETNLFAHHLDSDQIAFQSTLMKRFCEQEFRREAKH